MHRTSIPIHLTAREAAKAGNASVHCPGTEVNICGSSNGFLLCRTSSKAYYKFHYVVCNQVTGEFRVIPTSPALRQPQHGSVALAFVCEGASTSLDEVRFEVIRGSMESYAVETLSSPTLEVARFSSYTNANAWTTKVLVSDTPFCMRGCKLTACIAGGVIYWSFVHRIGKDDVPPRVQWYGVLAYDRAALTLRVIQLPWNVIREECAGCHGRCSGSGYLLDAPEGKLHIASHGHHKLGVWASNQLHSHNSCN